MVRNGTQPSDSLGDRRHGASGYDPQPGRALLWLVRGSIDTAVAAVRRLLAEASDPVAQCRLLPPAVDVLVTAGVLDDARAVVARLDEIAVQVGTEALQASAAFAGTTELASGDATGALPHLRRARRLWTHAQNPYEVARVRLVTGRALVAHRRCRVGAEGARDRARDVPGAGRDPRGGRGRASAGPRRIRTSVATDAA
jgi:hypothetical protein